MEILRYLVLALFGITFGSFLNVCIDRLPQGKSIAYPASYCDACEKRLSIRDLIPLFSYLWLRGRCRYCGTGISVRVPLVEILSGILVIVSFWRFGLSTEFVITAFYSCLFLVIIFIDWEQKLILNKVTGPAALVALVILAVDSFIPGSALLENIGFWPETSILSGLMAAAVGGVFFLLVFIVYPSGMGLGDVKLAALIGLTVGFPMVLVALFIGIIIGGLAAIILLSFKLKGRKDVMPYGVFLGIGPIVTLLWGDSILSWYLGLFGF
jgi:leader peptidase (prepilin peptidase)/N-methyltransferase